MKRQLNLLHFTSADLSPSMPLENRSFQETSYSSRHDSPEDFEVTNDLQELLTRQGIVFFKNRALERSRQSPENR